jgi:hypothetical protein
VLDRLQAGLGRGAADHERQVIGRAGRGPEHLHLLGEELHEARGVQDRLRLLEQEGLVRRAAALGEHQEVVLHPVRGVDVDLRRQVGPRVGLVVHGERERLGVAQVLARVGLEDAPRQLLGVAAAGENALPLLRDDGGGAGVLAHRQDEAGGHLGVAQQREHDAPVVLRGLRILEHGRELGQVARTIKEGDVPERLACYEAQRFGSHLQDFLPLERGDRDVVRGDLAIRRLVLRERERLVVAEIGHRPEPMPAAAQASMSQAHRVDTVGPAEYDGLLGCSPRAGVVELADTHV